MFRRHHSTRSRLRLLSVAGIALISALAPASIASAAGHGYGGGGGEGEGHGHQGEGSHRVVQIINVTAAAFTDRFSFGELQCQLQIAQGTYPGATQLVIQKSLDGFSSFATRSLGTLSVVAYQPNSVVVVTPLHPESLFCAGHDIGVSAFVVTGSPNSWTVVAGAVPGGFSLSVSDATPFTFVVGQGSQLLGLGSRGEQVELLAQLLRFNGQSVTYSHSVTASMVAALDAFQSSHGLTVTGTTTLATWYQLELK